MENFNSEISINHNDFFPDLINFIKILFVPTSREYDVIKRRFGLDGSRNYTLDEIGHFYNVTRERIRQIEAKGIERIQNELFLIVQEDSETAINSNEIKKTSFALKDFLLANYYAITEDSLLSLLSENIHLSYYPKHRGILELFLDVCGFSKLPEKINGFSEEIQPTWINESLLNRKTLYDVVKIVAKSLRKSPQPLSLFDLKIKVSKKRKENISDQYFFISGEICNSIERFIENEETYFQIKFDYLTSLADKAYRILSEEKQPARLKGLLKELNHRMVKSGRKANIPERSLQQQLVNDRRFAPHWKKRRMEIKRVDGISDRFNC